MVFDVRACIVIMKRSLFDTSSIKGPWWMMGKCMHSTRTPQVHSIRRGDAFCVQHITSTNTTALHRMQRGSITQMHLAIHRFKFKFKVFIRTPKIFIRNQCVYLSVHQFIHPQNRASLAVSIVFELESPNFVCPLPHEGQVCTDIVFDPVIFYLEAVTFTLKIIMQPTVSRVFELQSPNQVPTLPMIVGLPWQIYWTLWPLTLKHWPWPWNSCATCCVQGIQATKCCMNMIKRG